MTESRIQQECFMWHWNAYPEDRKALYLNYQNPKDARHGAELKGMGLISGVADMTYLHRDGTVTYFEFKTPTGRQSEAQIAFQEVVERRGARYLIVRSLEEFKEFFEKYPK